MNSTKSIAALFDFDGVVMDTETQYSIFWNEQGRKYHPELPEFGRLIKGQTLTQIYANYFAGMEEVQHEITEDLNKFEKNMLYNYIPGVEAFLKELFDSIYADPKTEVEVNLPEQTITNKATGKSEKFEINAYKKHCLMNGLDDIDFLVENKDKIEAYEKARN